MVRGTAVRLVLMVGLGAGCGDAQLNESRREPFFVAQRDWHQRYAPGLTVITRFPGLADAREPRFVSNNPSVATASVVDDVFQTEVGIGFPREAALLLKTANQGDAEIRLFDGEALVATESIQVIAPTNWRFDFTIQNQVAPQDAALSPDEPVQVVEYSPMLGVVRFYRGESYSAAGAIVASGRIESANRLLVDVVRDSLLPVSSSSGEFRFNQLSAGDIVSFLSANPFPVVGLELPNGERMFSDPIEGLPRVNKLQLVVSEKSQDDRADVAVYGLNEMGRVLGLDPEVTLDGVPLPQFGPRFSVGTRTATHVWPWLFWIYEWDTSGTLEARWQGLTASVELTR